MTDGWRAWAAAGVVLAAAIAVYLPGLEAGFVGDDFMILHRLRQVGSPADALRFFQGEFFEYYRPLGFVSHAADWLTAGADPRRFHLTSILLHAAATLIVWLLARTLAPGTWAAPVAALLFGLHAANHEAVMWISARFDLLATLFALLATLALVRGAMDPFLPAGLFLLALLSKESAAALPIAAAGWYVFGLNLPRAAVLARLWPWGAALAVYAALRATAGGVPAAGGPGRLFKLVALFVAVTMIVLVAGRWPAVASAVSARRRPLAAALAGALVMLALLAAAGPERAAVFAAEKLTVAGFAVTNLLSPVAVHVRWPFYLDTSRAAAWAGGFAAAALAVTLMVVLLPRLAAQGRTLFAAALLAAALLPVSALTEGTRYLYLPSAALALLVAMLVAALSPRAQRHAAAVAVLLAAVSAADVSGRVRDWRWAGRMTADGARLVDASLAPSCGEGHVVFLTSPVAVRGVYTHFYYETFELPRGCRPDLFQVVARMVRTDAPVVVEFTPDRLVATIPDADGSIVLSEDLRTFDRPVRRGVPLDLATPLGRVRAERANGFVTVSLDVAEAVRGRAKFFYYSDGRMREVTF